MLDVLSRRSSDEQSEDERETRVRVHRELQSHAECLQSKEDR